MLAFILVIFLFIFVSLFGFVSLIQFLLLFHASQPSLGVGAHLCLDSPLVANCQLTFEPTAGGSEMAASEATIDTNPFAWASPSKRARCLWEGSASSTMHSVWAGAPGLATEANVLASCRAWSTK